jgi:hypothetical protein
MSDFSDRLRSKLERMTSKEKVAIVAPYDEVLNEFVQTVNATPEIPFRAFVERGTRAQRRTITIRPRYGELPRVPILVMAIQDRKITILAEKRRTFSSSQALQKFLEKYLDTLGAAVEEFAEMEQQPVQGYLRLRGFQEPEREDVVIEVDPEDQRRLATATPGSALTFEIRVLRFPGAGTYDVNQKYVALESNGFALELKSHETLSSDQVRVSGTVAVAESAAA